MYATSALIVDEFAQTIVISQSLSASSIQNGVIVLIMYGVLWGTGLFAIFFFSLRQRKSKVSSKESEWVQSKQRAVKKKKSKDEIRKYLTDYVNEIFPSVFHSKTAFGRLMDEILKHHRYVLLVSTDGRITDSKRLLSGVQLLTVQSLLMFILAVMYDIQVYLFSSIVIFKVYLQLTTS